MNTVNASTGYSPFQLHLGRSPRLLPPILPHDTDVSLDSQDASNFLARLQADIWDAQDHLLAAKISQASSVNKHRSPEPRLQIGDRVLLSTKHRRREFLQQGDKRVAKFMPRYNGPYLIVDAHPETSTYTLDLPNSPNIFPTFHISQLRRFVPNDSELFPSRDHPRPGPVVTPDGQEENFIDRIIDERKVGRGKRYLVRWVGYGPEDDEWLSQKDLEDCKALDRWETDKDSPEGGRV